MFHSRRLEFLKTAKQRLSESHSFVYKLDVDVAVVAGNIQRFFSTIFIVRQIALTFFDFCLNGKIVIASNNRSRNIPVFDGQGQGAAYIQIFKGNTPAIGRNIYASSHGQCGKGYILICRG